MNSLLTHYYLIINSQSGWSIYPLVGFPLSLHKNARSCSGRLLSSRGSLRVPSRRKPPVIVCVSGFISLLLIREQPMENVVTEC